MDRYIRIYKESDFDFQYKLDSAHINTPFKFIFFTTDINESSYECSFDGEQYIRCTKVDDESIVFHIDGGVFECGNLRIRKEYFIDSSSFEDGICNSVDIEKTNIYIIEEGSNANSVVYCGSTLPNFDAMLIEQNVERAMVILNEKSDEIQEQMSYVILVKDEMEDLLDDATQWENRIENIENTYATQSYVQNKIDAIDFSPYPTFTDISSMGYITTIPDEYITQEELSANGYLTQHQSLANYPTFADINNMGYATKSYVQNKIDAIPQPDLSPYATKSYVANYVATYAPQPDLSNYPTYSYTNKNYVSYSYLADTVDDIVAGTVDLSNYVKKQELSAAGYITSIPSEYITQEELSANAYLTQHQSLDDYATKSYVVDYVATYAPEPDLSNYATKSYVVDYVATYAPEPDLSAYVTKDDLSGAGYLTSVPSEYITQEELSANAYLTQHQSLVDYVTKDDLSGAGYLTSVPSEYITQAELSANSYLTQHQSLADYVTKNDLSNAGYLTAVPSEYITQAELSANSYLTQHQDISGKVDRSELSDYVSKTELVNQSYATQTYVTSALNDYYTKTETNNLVSDSISTLESDIKSYTATNYPTYTYTKNNYPTYTYTRANYPTYTYMNNTLDNRFSLLVWQGTIDQYNALPDHTTYYLYLISQ